MRYIKTRLSAVLRYNLASMTQMSNIHFYKLHPHCWRSSSPWILTWGKSCSPSASPLPPSRSPSSSSKVSRLRAQRGQLSSSKRRGLGTMPASWYSSLWRPAGWRRSFKGDSDSSTQIHRKTTTTTKINSEVTKVGSEKWGGHLIPIVNFILGYVRIY